MPCCNSVENKTKALLYSRSALTEDAVQQLFNRLKPIQPEFLIGAWGGASIDTGHPGHKHLQTMRWAGKTFRSIDDVDPIVTFDDHGNRVCKEEYGHASVREIVFRGVVSAAIIYDSKPIFDHFRYVDENMVLGAMEAPKQVGPNGTYYFYLTRRL